MKLGAELLVLWIIQVISDQGDWAVNRARFLCGFSLRFYFSGWRDFFFQFPKTSWVGCIQKGAKEANIVVMFWAKLGKVMSLTILFFLRFQNGPFQNFVLYVQYFRSPKFGLKKSHSQERLFMRRKISSKHCLHNVIGWNICHRFWFNQSLVSASNLLLFRWYEWGPRLISGLKRIIE